MALITNNIGLFLNSKLILIIFISYKNKLSYIFMIYAKYKSHTIIISRLKYISNINYLLTVPFKFVYNVL